MIGMTYLGEELSALWKTLLGVATVSHDDDFFDLGGDSLQLVEMVVQLSQKFGIDFDYDRFFEEPKIRTLVAILEETKT